MTPAQVKMALQAKAMELAVTIMGVHSVCLTDDGTVVDAIFDIQPDESGCGLHFQFELPELVGRDELSEFSRWLTETDRDGETVH